jgi:hypothetical protein
MTQFGIEVPAFPPETIVKDTTTSVSPRKAGARLIVAVSCVDCPTVRFAGAATRLVMGLVEASAAVVPRKATETVVVAVTSMSVGMETRRLLWLRSAHR